MSTNFSNTEILPPKLKYKMAAKAQSGDIPEASSSVPKKSPSSTINDKSNTVTTVLKRKSSLMKKYEEETKPSPPTKYKGESSKSGAKRATYRFSKRKAEATDVDDTDWTDDIPFCPTYYPTSKEFQDPMAYLQKISLEASEYGICKIVSPVSTSVPPLVVLKKENKPEKFLAEYLPLNAGYREAVFKRERNYTVDSFETMANDQYERRYKSLAPLPPSLVEKDFWKRIAQKNGGSVEYVNGLKTSAFSSDPDDQLGRSEWNLQNFAHLEQSSLRLLDREIEGITDSLLYLGMLFSYIFWSTEPGHLYSIEYHHCGAPRTWYGSPGSASYDFESMVKEIVFPEEGLQRYEAYDILNFKTMLFSPRVMLKNEVPIFKTVQYPGEFVVTFPKAYHMAINHGFNCWEEAHFATPHWFPFGDDASERRALYIRPEIVPYQELLCKEAMFMFVNKRSELDLPSYRELKVNFTALIKLHHFACEEISTRGGAHVIIAPHSEGVIHCGACSRECHLAYVTCKCFPTPICVFHDIYEKCRCKTRTVSVREELAEMQTVAKSFETDDQTLPPEVHELAMARSAPLGCWARMELEAELEDLISLEAECQNVGLPAKRAKKNRRPVTSR